MFPLPNRPFLTAVSCWLAALTLTFPPISVVAQTVTVEFENAGGVPAGATDNWFNLGITNYSESGITITTSDGSTTNFGDQTSAAFFAGNLENPNSTGDFLFIPEVPPTLTITASGSEFSFDSLVTGTSGGGIDTFEITGNLAAGGTVPITVDAPANGPNGPLTFFALAGLTGLTSATITNTSPDGARNYLIFDSLTFTIVTVDDPVDSPKPPPVTTPTTDTPVPVIEEPSEPVTIVALDPIISAQNSGFIGSIGSQNFFSPGLTGHLRSILIRGRPYRQEPPNLVPSVASSNDPRHGVVHPFAGSAMFTLPEVHQPDEWVFWSQGGFENQDQDVIGAHPGFVANSHLGSVGVDRYLNPQLLVGFAVTGGDKDIDGGGNLGSADIEGLILDTYALWQRDPFWSSLRCGVGWIDIESYRNAAAGIVARGDSEAFQTVIDWKAGHHRALELGGKTFVHGPDLGLRYFTSSMNGFTERGANLFNLRYRDYAHASLVSNIGWTFSAPLDNDWFDGWLQLRLGWSREHIHKESNLDYTFETSPIVIIQDGEIIGRGPDVSGESHIPTPQDDYALFGLTLMAYDLGKNENWNATVNYEAQLFRSDYHEQYVSLNFSRPF
ncbi:MAG: autotransporter outer membrane beta-barrel domain-containing protein [Verrucomicrobiota bacterium]